MSVTGRSTRLGREQGMALIAVMLLLMAMSALAAALAISSATETMIAANHQSAAQARAAAEAGLTHAVDMTLDYLAGWQGDFASIETALDALLADPAMWIDGFDAVEAGVALVGTGSTFSNIAYSGGSFTSIMYEAMLLDDDAANARDLSLSAADMTRMGENDDPADDLNKKFVIRAIGYAGGNAVAAVEATIGAMEMPAILSDDDFDAAGSFSVEGARGSIHTNKDFTQTGTAWSAEEGCTSSMTSEDGDSCTAGEPNIAVPDVRACTYVGSADYVLHDDGTMTTVATPGTCAYDEMTDEWVATFVDTAAACDPCAGGWEFASGKWTLSGTPTEAVYYIEGKDTDVAISANGTLTILTEGDVVDGTGGNLMPIAGVMIVADGDINLNAGSPNIGSAVSPGLVVVGEQMDLRGNVTIYGQIIIRNARAYSGEVTTTQLSGSVQVVYEGGLDGQFFSVSAWRRSY